LTTQSRRSRPTSTPSPCTGAVIPKMCQVWARASAVLLADTMRLYCLWAFLCVLWVGFCPRVEETPTFGVLFRVDQALVAKLRAICSGSGSVLEENPLETNGDDPDGHFLGPTTQADWRGGAADAQAHVCDGCVPQWADARPGYVWAPCSPPPPAGMMRLAHNRQCILFGLGYLKTQYSNSDRTSAPNFHSTPPRPRLDGLHIDSRPYGLRFYKPPVVVITAIVSAISPGCGLTVVVPSFRPGAGWSLNKAKHEAARAALLSILATPQTGSEVRVCHAGAT
jgi:hypothetical protein